MSDSLLIEELALERQRTARLRDTMRRILQAANGGWHDNSRLRFSEIIALASDALAGEEAAAAEPALCAEQNGAVRCSREAGHPGFHTDGGLAWGTSMEDRDA